MDKEGRCFQGRWNLQYFFTESRNNCVCLVCHETVSVHKEYNEKRHYKTKHASTFNKLSEADRIEKAKQLEDSLATRELYFKRAHESNKSITKASLEVAFLVAKHSKPFAEGEFVKNLCYENGRTHLPLKEGLRQCLFRSEYCGTKNRRAVYRCSKITGRQVVKL